MLPRRRAGDRIKAAFLAQRVIAPAPDLFDRAGVVFRALHGDGRGLRDRLGVVNDLLIALTASRIGATVVTANVDSAGSGAISRACRSRRRRPDGTPDGMTALRACWLATGALKARPTPATGGGTGQG